MLMVLPAFIYSCSVSEDNFQTRKPLQGAKVVAERWEQGSCAPLTNDAAQPHLTPRSGQ